MKSRTVLAIFAAVCLATIALSLGLLAWRTYHPHQDPQIYRELLYATCIQRSMAVGNPNPATHEATFDQVAGDTVAGLARRCLRPEAP